MIPSLFRKDAGREAASALYRSAAEQALSPGFYTALGVPDTFEGRFDILAVHAYLILRRLKGAGPEAERTAQKLFDAFFAGLDDALREMGVGDLVVGRRIRGLAEAFYGRIGAYEAAFAAEAAPDALAASLARNVYGEADGARAARLAEYVRSAALFIDAQPLPRLLGGIIRFPDPPAE